MKIKLDEGISHHLKIVVNQKGHEAIAVEDESVLGVCYCRPDADPHRVAGWTQILNHSHLLNFFTQGFKSSPFTGKEMSQNNDSLCFLAGKIHG